MIICKDIKPDIVIDTEYLAECRRNFIYFYKGKKYKSMMTQTELAKKLSKTVQQIRRYESKNTAKDKNSTQSPPSDVIKKMVLILNLDLYRLFGLKQYEVYEDLKVAKHTIEEKEMK